MKKRAFESAAARTQLVQAQPPTSVFQAPLVLWMVGPKLKPIATRRRQPGFESFLFRSLVLASGCLATSRGLNHPAAAPSGGYLGCGHQRAHFLHLLGKSSTPGVRAHYT